ncbi:amidohydrolase [Nocardioides luteus]|uniref:Amidohydrolase n=1 Tax=Nocardioides luteus TaxID=1844 RepID=A0A1J4N5S6_9ACTN|nr:amidohydrolase [Nocardioides luteus]OIJ25809.1 amidohydrolase [Nocardioides luteus]
MKRPIDVHQHLWPPALIEELRSRRQPPCLDGWVLHLDGEPPYSVNPADHDLTRRTAQEDGLVLLSLSSPLGIESLSPDDAHGLLDAWHGFADDLPGLWAAPGLVEPDLDGLAATLTHDRVHGLQVPATALATPSALEALAAVLATAQQADLPVLVHPGPAVPHPADDDVPGWWPALTSYVAQQSAAWHSWHVAGRSLLPTLRIAFVGLAGLAPLHHERLAQRGGHLGAIDRHVYYETSSYGTQAIDAMSRVVGVDPLVNGSDRPYAEPSDPGLGDALTRAILVANPRHLLTGGDR